MHGLQSGGVRRTGGPKTAWREVVETDCQTQQLNTEDFLDYTECRKLTRDIAQK